MTATSVLALPEAEVPAEAIAAWFAAEGSGFVGVRRVATEVIAAEGVAPDRCSGWVEELRDGLSPADLRVVAAGAPDQVLGAALIELLSSLNRVLSRCVSGEPQAAAHLDSLAGALQVIDERLEGR